MEGKGITMFDTNAVTLKVPAPLDFVEDSLQCLYNFPLIPFKVLRTGNKIELQQRTWRKILTAVILITATIHHLVLGAQFSLKNLYREPVFLFRIMLQFIHVAYVGMILYVFWRKSDDIIHFLELSTPASFKVNKSEKLIRIFVIWVVPAVFNLAIIINYFAEYVRILDYNNWLACVEFLVNLIGVLVAVLLCHFIDVFILILSLAAYGKLLQGEKALEDLQKGGIANKMWTQGDFSRLLAIPVEMEEYFCSFNKIGSGFYLVWFLMIVPWVSYNLMGKFPGTLAAKQLSNWEYASTIVYYWPSVILYIGVAILCVEVQRKAEKMKNGMKRMILNYDPMNQGHGALIRLDLIFDNIAIRGLHFFKFSYGFLGSMASFMVAYVFLALQLEATSNC